MKKIHNNKKMDLKKFRKELYKLEESNYEPFTIPLYKIEDIIEKLEKEDNRE